MQVRRNQLVAGLQNMKLLDSKRRSTAQLEPKGLRDSTQKTQMRIISEQAESAAAS